MGRLDAIDRQLLAILQKDARCSLKRLAERVFLSPPAVAVRLERLEKLGAILGYRAEIDARLLGYEILAYVNLQVAPADKPGFMAYIDGVPCVLSCDCVTGEYSMLIKACFRDTGALEALIGELQRYGKTYTQIVYSTAVRPRGPRIEDAE